MTSVRHNPYPQKPWLAALLAFLFGPLGFLYTSNLLAVMSILIALVFMNLLVYSTSTQVVLRVFFGLAAVVWLSRRPRMERFPQVAAFDAPGWKKGLGLATLFLLSAWAYTLFIRTYVSTPGYPMAPTILSGERVEARLLPWERASVQRGTAVMYLLEYQGKRQRAISRVVALAGDTVTVRRGLVYVNGQSTDSPALIAALRKAGCLNEGLSLNNTANAQGEGPVHVPPGHVFLMADNRSGLFMDSRFFGPLPSAKILGVLKVRDRPVGRAKSEDCLQPSNL